jgi:hypothetical protein
LLGLRLGSAEVSGNTPKPCEFASVSVEAKSLTERRPLGNWPV